MTANIADQRLTRLIGRVAQKEGDQNRARIEALRARPDFRPELDYFVRLLADLSPAKAAERAGRPLVGLMCLQAPLELFHALDLQPFKIYSGSYVTGQLAVGNLPAIMCPMLRSLLGALRLDFAFDSFKAWVLPTTCDWVVKFPEMLKLTGGVDLGSDEKLHWLELPHLKENEDSRTRWLEEMYKLNKFLLRLTGRKKLKPARLAEALEAYQRAWRALSRLTEARRLGQVPAVWYTLISNGFFYDSVERWTAALEQALPLFSAGAPAEGRVFLAGSPVFFPNYKIFDLLEEAGLTVTADDLCSSERIFPGAVNYSDRSEFGLMSALAERYHQGCLCPTFADNGRRVNNIISPQRKTCYEGVVFQVLKGCHPYDLESFSIAETLKDNGLRYLRLDTDHSAEDSRNLLTRLEAYRHNLVDGD